MATVHRLEITSENEDFIKAMEQIVTALLVENAVVRKDIQVVASYDFYEVDDETGELIDGSLEEREVIHGP